MKRRTIAVIVIASVVGLAAIGTGVWGVKTLVDNSFKIQAAPAAAAVVKTATPTPTPTVVPVGGILDEETALGLRQDMPANGDYAYKLPDGRWIKTNRLQPLPDAVVAAEEAKVNAAPHAQAGVVANEFSAAVRAAYSLADASQFATGKTTVVVTQIPFVADGGSTSVIRWGVVGHQAPPSIAGSKGGWDSAAEATAAAQAAISALPDAASYAIIVGQH
ncbi:hypothetical protein ACFVU2_18935 [Leifsonia sp. NPDC058194]|uniref:hypothetical protein n=1 Tax=Leifsonia sp. NPDC058194 TaxID=3346374 RepID=UPI0036DA66B6